mgnify:CR=1 FL=1
MVVYTARSRKMEHLIRAKGSGVGSMERMGNVGDRILDYLHDDPEHVLMALDMDYDGDTDVYKVNVKSRKRTFHFRGKFGLTNWELDQDKQVRWGTGYKAGKRIAYYLNPLTEKWQAMDEVDWYKNAKLSPIMFFADPRFAYVYYQTENDLKGIAKFDMIEGKIVEKIYANDSVDVSGIALSPETGKVIGTTYTGHYPEIHFTSKQFESLYGQIRGIFADGWVSIVDMNMEKKIFIIYQSSNKFPGAYYYLDGKTGELVHLLDVNPLLDTTLLSEVSPVHYNARDNLIIPGYLTLPKDKGFNKLPTIIFPHGGPGARDTMSYDRWAQYFASRGYAVLQPNFRGSTGYGDEFQDMGEKQWGGTMQDDVTDGTKWMIEEGIADPENICIAGISYGGYAALMGAVKEPDLYKCVISINGVADLPGLISNDRQYVGGRAWSKSIGLEGENTKIVSPYHQAEKIIAPVLIVHSRDDSRVPYKQGKNMARKLSRLKKDVTYVEVENGDHSLDTEGARLATFNALDEFLKKHLN